MKNKGIVEFWVGLFLLLGIVGLGLVADAPRLIVSTIMTAFDKPMSPNVISLVLMSLGILGSYLLSMNKDDSFSIISMFAFRSATILLAALINLFMMYKSVVGLFAALDKKSERNPLIQAVSTTEATREETRVVPIPISASEVKATQPSFFARCYCRFFGVKHDDRPSVVVSTLGGPLLREAR